MIRKLSIKNFKSIKELEIDCRRINLFIGEPNTGKSNILEVLSLLSWCGYGNTHLREYVRFQDLQNLFYDGLIKESVEIKIENTGIVIEIKLEDDNFRFYYTVPSEDDSIARANRVIFCTLNYLGEGSRSDFKELKFIKLYKFEEQDNFKGRELSFLMPPHGSNMFAIVNGSEQLYEAMTRFFSNSGFRLMSRTREMTFEFLKEVQGKIFSYPYILASDTLQRIIFHTIAIESNENSILIFEEPEAHAFPYYTKYLGEKIAFDDTNQYFITTHNPYFLLSILEKAPKDDVNVFITYSRDYQTKVKRLEDKEVSKLMRYDLFFNLDSFIGDERGK